jgi:hypothetical protein
MAAKAKDDRGGGKNGLSGNGDEDDDDDREEANATSIWMISTGVASLAMVWAGKVWFAGILAVLWALFGLSGRLMKPLSVAEKKAIEYNMWSAEDCYAAAVVQHQTPLDDVAKLALLGALSKKYHRCCLVVKDDFAKKKEEQHQSVNPANGSNSTSSLLSRREEVALICHNAAHEIIRQQEQEGDEDQRRQQQPVEQVLDAALALLALVATEPLVRRRYGADDGQGVEIVIQLLHRARLRAKQYREPEMEQRAAELQRKGCLLLGALANNTRNAAAAATSTARNGSGVVMLENNNSCSLGQLILVKGGMQCIVDAMAWFRCHEHVANWALWAIFTLLYDHPEDDDQSSPSSSLPSTTTNTNTTAIQHLLNANGGPVILAALENCGHHVDVARHGMAIIYHLVVAQNIPLPPAPVIRIVEQLLVAHHFPTTTNEDSTIPTNPDEMSHSARQQIALMGRDILVRLQGCHNQESIHSNTNQE